MDTQIYKVQYKMFSNVCDSIIQQYENLFEHFNIDSFIWQIFLSTEFSLIYMKLD